jgi:glycosyltransferase involved in cell wall biosynthesis
MKPILSVITIVKNAELTIERTITSVINQNFDSLQYIVIDGKSSDRTIEIINKYRDIVDIFISEPDKGTSDAFNKAFNYVNGKYVICLAADDCLGTNFLSHAVKTMENSNADVFWGAMTMYSKNGVLTEKLHQNTNILSCLQKGKGLNFPSMMSTSEYWRLIGGLDLSFKFCNDLEWLCRAFLIQEPVSVVSNKVSVHRDEDGLVSKNAREAAIEMIRLFKKYKYPISPLLRDLVIFEVIKFLSYFKGIFKKWYH